MLTEEEVLLQQLDEDGVLVLDSDKLSAWSDGDLGQYAVQNDIYVIAYKHNLDASSRLVVLLHEAGHHYTGMPERGAYEIDIARFEHRATRWAVYRILPPHKLYAAAQQGITEPWEMADHFGLPEWFLRKALDMYISIGEAQACGMNQFA